MGGKAPPASYTPVGRPFVPRRGGAGMESVGPLWSVPLLIEMYLTQASPMSGVDLLRKHPLPLSPPYPHFWHLLRASLSQEPAGSKA